MIKNPLLFIASSLVLISPTYTFGDRLQPSAFKTTLDNGMTVIIEENHSSPVAAIQAWVKVGSADEDEGIYGIAHVFEHMLFKGTSNRKIGEIAKEVDEAGGNINAFTSNDHTVYHIVLASRFFEKGLDILGDAIQNSSFDPQELAKETEVVLEELKMGEDDPSRKLYLKLQDASYALHPYKRPVIGFRDTVKNLKRDDILKFFKKWYAPNNITLVIVGDIYKDKTLAAIKETFKDFKQGEDPHKKRLIEPPQREIRGFILQDEIGDARLGLTFHIPELSHPDIYAIDALALILGQGESSRLYQRLKAQGLVTSISSYAMTPKEPGLFFITSSLEAGNIQKVVQNIMDEISRIKHEGVTSAELEKAKLNLESEFIYSRETMEGRARQLGYFEVSAGGLDYEKRYLQGITKLTIKDIKTAAERYLTRDNMTIGILMPKEAKEGITLDEVFKTITSHQLSVVGNNAVKKTEIQKIKLDNGITLLIREDHTNPVAALHAAFMGGVRLEDEKTNGLTNFAAKMLTKGTNKRSALDIAKELDGMAGTIEGFSGRNSVGMSGKFLSRFFDKGFELFADMLQNPTFPDDEIERVRKEILSQIKNQEDYLPGYTFSIFSETLFEKHPYRLNPLGTKELIANYKRQDIVRFYETLFRPEGMVISVVGDVKAEDVIIKAKQLFRFDRQNTVADSSAQLKYSPLPSPAHEKRQTAIKKKEVFKEKKQAHIAIGFLGGTIAGKDRDALQVISSIMSGQGGRLFIELRDKKPLAYSVTAIQRDGIEPGFFAVYMGTSPEKTDEAVSGILYELKKMAEKGITDDELKRAKAEIIGNYEIGLQEVSDRASGMTFNELYGLGYDEYKRFAKRIESVTKESVLDTARKYFDMNAYTIVIVRPEKIKP